MGKKRRARIKVVLDTNIWISLILNKLVAESLGPLIRKNQNQHLAIYLSYQMLTDLARVLTIPKIAEILERANVDPRVALADVAKMVSLRAVREGTLDVITSDVSDNRILECAVHSKADYVVTGDLHLLELEDFRDIKCITVREFINAMKPQQTVG